MNWAQAMFWISALLLFYIYVGYPLLLVIVALFRRGKSPELGYTPSLSILIAACNEEANIRRKLEETLQLDYAADKMEILVLSDGSRDCTDEIVKEFAGQGVRLVRHSGARRKNQCAEPRRKAGQGRSAGFFRCHH